MSSEFLLVPVFGRDVSNMQVRSDGFKIIRAMLAQRTDKVSRQRLTLVNVAADGAAVALFLLGGSRFLRLWFDIALVVAVGYAWCVTDYFTVRHFRNEHGMGSKIDHVGDPAGKEGVCVAGQVKQTVAGA